jgi:hypothetical protein
MGSGRAGICPAGRAIGSTAKAQVPMPRASRSRSVICRADFRLTKQASSYSVAAQPTTQTAAPPSAGPSLAQTVVGAAAAVAVAFVAYKRSIGCAPLHSMLVYACADPEGLPMYFHVASP